MIEISWVDSPERLEPVLALCYDILGDHLRQAEGYRPQDWRARIAPYGQLLLYAHRDGQVVAAALGRPESPESLICGFVACRADCRGQGVARRLMDQLAANARRMGFGYITLGAQSGSEGFYEACGYRVIAQQQGQRIYQLRLDPPAG